MHMARLWDSSRPMKGGYSLESLSRDVLLDRKRPIKELFGKKILKDGSEAKLNVMPDLSELQRDPKTRPAWIDYSTNDAVATWLLHQRLSEFLRNKSCVHCNTLLDFYNAKWRDFGELLTDIERAGVYLRTDYLSRIEAQATADAESHWSGFREWVAKQCPDGKFMNVKSRTQVQQLLFAPATLRSGKALGPERIFKMENLDNYIEPGKDKALKQRPFVISGLGIEPVSFTANGMPSVDSAALELLAGDPLADPPRYGSAYKSLGGNEAGREACLALDGVVKATAIEKLLNTYICPLQLQIDAQSRIHCSLNLNTGTGRLSARRPNLQNQPSLEKDVYKVRDAFAAAPGMKLVVADYGQLEV
uniref:DNA-directed DNA polymerase family A palm domain-containing protein n=1 Tax=Spongospora subterranea TaxID=70186 RepID=A0A0H5QJ94_9EUKA|eukprot:CRZ01366.1 hypothetical protein [Spongospora subterranea]